MTPLAPWFKRPANENETLVAIDLVHLAIRQRRVIRVQYFRELDGRWFRDSLNGVFGRRKKLRTVPVWREFEPVELDTNAYGEPYATVISPDPTGGDGPQYRTLRLDRVAVDHRGLRLEITDRPCTIRDTAYDPAWHGVH